MRHGRHKGCHAESPSRDQHMGSEIICARSPVRNHHVVEAPVEIGVSQCDQPVDVVKIVPRGQPEG
jgi:hypothetical protein